MGKEHKNNQPCKSEEKVPNSQSYYKTKKRRSQEEKDLLSKSDEKCENKLAAKLQNSSDTPNKEKEIMSSKLNDPITGTPSPYTLSNKRMTVPQQKKPKKSFEEALFEGFSSEVSMKRQSKLAEKTCIKTSKSNTEKVLLK